MVNTQITDVFRHHHAKPLDFNNEMHNFPDWQPFVVDWALLGVAYADSNIPCDLLDNRRGELKRKPEADAIERDLTDMLCDHPSLAEFKYCIQMSKSSSAPGMSGLFYNMLKSLPDHAIEYYNVCFAQFWLSDGVTASWKSR